MFEFGGLSQLTVTRSLGGFLVLLTSHPVSAKDLQRVSSARTLTELTRRALLWHGTAGRKQQEMDETIVFNRSNARVYY